MIADGDEIPEPSSLSDLVAAGEDVADFFHAVTLAIPLLPAQGRFVKVPMTMDQNFLARVDGVTKTAARSSPMQRCAFWRP